MLLSAHPFSPRFLCLATSILLAACGAQQKKTSAWDLYELNNAQKLVYPRDNDYYYTQPGTYTPQQSGYAGCSQINDSPSCGGG